MEGSYLRGLDVLHSKGKEGKKVNHFPELNIPP